MGRVVVPKDVFDALEQQRRRHGVMFLLNPLSVAADMILLDHKEAAQWVIDHQEETVLGVTQGFWPDDHVMPAEPSRATDDDFS